MDESLDTVLGLKNRGFKECCSVKNLRDALGVHPAAPPPHYRLPKPDKDLRAAWKKHKLCAHKGIYLVIWEWKDRPEFLNPGTGGCFKRKDPNVKIDMLEDIWVEDALIIYVGANREGKNGNLETRIEQLIRFGSRKNTGHYGGRLMWQIKDAEDLKIRWKVMADDKQENEKEQVLAEFEQVHQSLPFANIIH